MRLHNPLQRRRQPLIQADDRIWVWIILQGWLLGWGLGVLVEPAFPDLFTRPFAVAALWPFVLLPRWGLAAVFLGSGLAMAASCWLAFSDDVRMALRLAGAVVVVVIFWSYGQGNFPYAVLQFGVVLGVLGVSYLYMPREC